MTGFERYRGTSVYQYLLTQDPGRHPWLRWGMSPSDIARSQYAERQWLAQQQGRMRGVGDAVARITGALGVKPCEPCKERQAKLNRWFPFS